ncbi:hypothetical protein BS78_05G196300 [Paspalum vaginatum]|nr:hypothetical protein BS78_05G196300 [Paspalum vaginatum]
MESGHKRLKDKLDCLISTVGFLSNRMDALATAQHKMQAQINLNTEAVNQTIQDQQTLAAQVEATGKAVSCLTLEKMAHDMKELSDTSSQLSDMPPLQSPRGPPQRSGEPHRSKPHTIRPDTEPNGLKHSHLPKLNFPKFEVENPKIWIDKCEDYFSIFGIRESMWVTAASLHMEGKAAQWFLVYKVQNKVNTWAKFVQAVMEKFGVYEHQHALNDLLDLKQTHTVEEYVDAFETLQYQVSLHNGNMGELYFVAQFIKGLKHELQFGVQAQVPETMERAIMLAKIQQQLLDKNNQSSTKTQAHTKPSAGLPPKLESKPVFNPALSRERQLRDYRRAHGLCYFCGENFDATHLDKCPKRPKQQLHALVVNDLDVPLTEEVLNQLEVEDTLAEEFCTLSLNALAGTDTGSCMKLRALVNNKVMLILVDSGSSHSFVSTQFLNQVPCSVTSVAPS